MALINCPNCGARISDKARKCPKCGVEPKQRVEEKQIAEDSHTVEADSTPENQQVPQYLKENAEPSTRMLWWIAFSIIVVIIVGSIFVSLYTQQNNQATSYEQNDSIAAAELEAARLESIAAEQARLDSLRQDSIARRNFTTPDLAFNELHGHVDICKSGSGAGSYYTTFSYNNMGELILIDNVRPKYTRDKNGQITKDGDGDDVTIYKWKDNKISTELRSGLQYESNEYGPVIIRYFYNSDNQLAYTTNDDSDRNWGEGQRRRKYKITYSNYQFDEMGNWISRKATSTYQYNFGDGWENCTDEWTEDRIITYHDSNIGKD